MKKQQSNQYKSRETYQNAAGLLFGLSQDDEHDRLIKEQLLGQLTEKELKSYHLRRSGDWCGTNWEQKDMARIQRILEDRNKPPYRKPSLWRRALQLFS